MVRRTPTSGLPESISLKGYQCLLTDVVRSRLFSSWMGDVPKKYQKNMKFMNRLSISGSAALPLALVFTFSSGCGKDPSSEPKPTQTTPSAPASVSVQSANRPSSQPDTKTVLKKLPTIDAAICKIDVTNRTIRVALWNGKERRGDSTKVLVWNDQTQLLGATNTLTMAQFVGGKVGLPRKNGHRNCVIP